MSTNAPKSLYDYDAGNLGLRDLNDINLSQDINQLQIQIGDLTETLSEFGDLIQARDENGDLISDTREVVNISNLTEMLNSIKRKIIFTTLDKDINGSFINNSGKIQINTIQNHGFIIGDKITITNSSNGSINTFHKILSVNSATSITLTTNFVVSSGGQICKHNGKNGKILQHGEVLIPAGLVFIIAGDVSNAGESDVIGANSCPSGYIECDNITIIAEPNSPFYDLENDGYTSDLRGLMVRGFAGNGSLNNPYPSSTYLNPASDVFGDIFGNEDIIGDNHKHKITSGVEGTFPSYIGHKHNFIHGHLHQHTVASHNHLINTHTHPDSSHYHLIMGGHDHKISKLSLNVKESDLGDTYGLHDGLYERFDGGDDGTHDHDHINGGSNVNIYVYDIESGTRTSEEDLSVDTAVSPNNSSSTIISSNIPAILSSAGVNSYTSSETLTNHSGITDTIPKFRSIKFCMKT